MATSSAVKRKLSWSTEAAPILVAATATAWTLIHTCYTTSTFATKPWDYDEIWLYATNNHTADVNLTLEVGWTTVGYLTQMSIPAKTGDFAIKIGKIFNNTQVIRAFASVANVVAIDGFVNLITES